MIFDPEYGKKILNRFSDDITIYDYTNKTKEENPLGHEGILLIIWDGRYNCSINYQKDRVLFKIEDDYYKYINNNIFHDSLTKAHYEYYSDYITYLKSHAKNIADMSYGFRQQLPNNYVRDEKLKELI
jgi:hypothetical protein